VEGGYGGADGELREYEASSEVVPMGVGLEWEFGLRRGDGGLVGIIEECGAGVVTRALLRVLDGLGKISPR